LKGALVTVSATHIQYTLNDQDMLTFTRHYLKANRTVRRALRWNTIILTAAALFFAGATAIAIFRSGRINTDCIAPFALTVFFCAALAWFRRRYRRAPDIWLNQIRREGHGRSYLGKQSVELTSDAVVWATPLVQVRTQWAGIWKIETTSEHLFVFTSHISGIIVPRRAFSNAVDFDSFAAQARRWRSQAPAYELLCPQCGYDLSVAETPGCPECGWRREGALDKPRYTS
jgi:hypothetical protein